MGVVIASQPTLFFFISMQKIFEIVQQVGGFQVFLIIFFILQGIICDGEVQDIRNRLADFNVEVRVLDAGDFHTSMQGK